MIISSQYGLAYLMYIASIAFDCLLDMALDCASKKTNPIENKVTSHVLTSYFGPAQIRVGSFHQQLA